MGKWSLATCRAPDVHSATTCTDDPLAFRFFERWSRSRWWRNRPLLAQGRMVGQAPFRGRLGAVWRLPPISRQPVPVFSLAKLPLLRPPLGGLHDWPGTAAAKFPPGLASALPHEGMRRERTGPAAPVVEEIFGQMIGQPAGDPGRGSRAR